jgi:glycosyltransferase involved in cell wall biosynthesis
MSNFTKISVIVPLYNTEKYLTKCLDSIERQTYEQLEIIVVDDGSTDGSGAIADRYAERDGRIKVIHKRRNEGLYHARLTGVRAATGEYIGFVDSDDTVSVDYFRSLLFAAEEAGADITLGRTVEENERGERYIHNIYHYYSPGKMTGEEARRAYWEQEGSCFIFHTVWNKLYRRSIIGDILFEKGKYNEDDYWTYQVFDRAKKVAIVGKPMYNYLQRAGSIMGVGYNPRRLEGLQARVLRMEYLQKYPETADLTRQNLVLDCMWHLQSILRHLEGQAQKNAKRTVLDILKAVPKVPSNKLTLNAKYKLWYSLFRAAPVLTAKLRNMLKIGL